MEATTKQFRKRNAILSYLRSVTNHPSAEMVFTELKTEIPDLSMGTVYRNLGVLVQEGQIISVGHINGQERYDAVTHAHPHFVCKSCGSVTDLELPDMVSPMFGLIDSSFHCEPQGYNLTINGLCHKCRS